MKVKVYAAKKKVNGTPNGKLVCVAKLPVRQTLIWAGPVFIHIRRGR